MLNLSADAGAHVREVCSRSTAANSADAGEIELINLDVAAVLQPAGLLHGLDEHQLGGHALGHGLVVDDARELADRARAAISQLRRIGAARIVPRGDHVIDNLGARGHGGGHDEALALRVRHRVARAGLGVGIRGGSAAAVRVAQPRAGGGEGRLAALNGLRAGRHGTRGRVQPVPGVARLEPAGAHDARAVHVEPVGSDLDPAGLHDAFTVEVVPLAAIEEPAGGHHAVGAHVVPLLVVLGELPAGEHTTVILEEVPVIADIRPADGHRAGVVQPEPAAAVREPAGDHGALAIQVVPGAPVLDPAGRHVALGTQVVPLAVVLLPARHHRGGVVEEVSASVDGGPSADRATVGVRPVPAATRREPAGLGLAVAHEAP